VSMTSLPSRLGGAGPALHSIAKQTRRPDHLILSLPRRSSREGRDYELPEELGSIIKQHPWMEVNWLEEDVGPGTKLLGGLQWCNQNLGTVQEGDILMVLDDDHEYVPWAIAELEKEQLARGPSHICSFFAYFFRGIMVPQGADIVAYQLTEGLSSDIHEYYRKFVAGDPACFLVDDLWAAMYMQLCGKNIVSLRETVVKRGLQMVYRRTDNAKIEALMDLEGENRRDRVSVRAFDSLLSRLIGAGSQELERWGGATAADRLKKLNTEVRQAEKRIVDLETWFEQEKAEGGDEAGHVQQPLEMLNKLRHLYRMLAPAAPGG